MLKVKRVMMIRDLCKMFNFVRILRAPECYSLCGQLTDYWTASALIKLTSERASKPTSEQASEQKG